MFINTTVGIDTDVNMIDPASRVQVYRGTLRFYVAVPSTPRNSGVRAIIGADTLDGALKLAAGVVDTYRVKFERLHARALKMNAAR